MTHFQTDVEFIQTTSSVSVIKKSAPNCIWTGSLWPCPVVPTGVKSFSELISVIYLYIELNFRDSDKLSEVLHIYNNIFLKKWGKIKF